MLKSTKSKLKCEKERAREEKERERSHRGNMNEKKRATICSILRSPPE
jgi:hypothetical protein